MRLRLSHLLAATIIGAFPLAPMTLAGNPGPDVIVGDLPDTFAYGAAGTPAYHAYDLGTSSCNLGNVNLLWVASTNQHPVIAQNIYRLKDGRLEQLGGSWVKHGFTALTQNLCATCNGQGGSVLGVGCSDPYDFGLNGQQSGLGPRSEINAATGAFIYNPASWPGYSGTDPLARRIRVLGDEVNPASNSGALYFGEAIYIAADDAAAGNSWNNASYRRMRFLSNSVFSSTFAIPGVNPAPTTQRTRPAIQAWRDYGGGLDANGQPIADPNIRLQPIDVPGDGRLWVAHKVTDNGNGTWRYEYAVFNLTSDRCAASLTIPVILGSTTTNAGFRDIAAHSGEPYDSTNWNFVAGHSTASWSCFQTFSQNPNANALRWGTMYNFWFDSTAAPGQGSASIGLFKPGAGAYAALGSVALRLRTPGGANVAVAPLNDSCAQAVAVHSGQNGFSTVNAATEGPTECDSAGAGTGAIASDLWFKYTYIPHADTCPGSITIDTCGSEFDTKLAVYSGTACPDTAGTAIACSDDGAPCASGASQVSFPATPGATYLIRVGSLSGTTGNGLLNITVPFCIPQPGSCCFSNGSCITVQGAANCPGGTWLGSGVSCVPNPCPQPPPPANDLCANALPIGDSAAGAPVITATNVAATTDQSPFCDFGSQSQKNLWYSYTPILTGPVTIDTCIFPASALDFDTVLNLYSSCGGTPLACSDDGDCAPRSSIAITLTAGTAYLISVGGYFGDSGDFVLRVTSAPGACCAGSTCTIVSQSGCAGPGSRFTGPGLACNASLSTNVPCCRADFNQDGIVSIDDLFLYINAHFSSSPAAAITSNGTSPPVLDDLFLYINAYFVGC